MRYEFRWNEWNVDHIAEHGVTPEEAQEVVEHPARGFPRRERDKKLRVWGQTNAGRFLQVVYTFSPGSVVFIIHARDLTDLEKRQARRRSR